MSRKGRRFRLRSEDREHHLPRKRPAGGAKVGHRRAQGGQAGEALSDDEQAALYALRCSFAHDYSLINIPLDDRRADLFHMFQLVWTVGGPLIELPPTPWDGTFGLGIPSHRTVVNLFEFEELTESVVVEVQDLARRDELELGSDLTSHEFALRYGMTVT